MARILLFLLLVLLPWLDWAQETVMAIDVKSLDFYEHGNRPAPEVVARKDTLTFYPCSQCHKYWKTNPQPRVLAPVHDVGLKHGAGQLWCLVCHDPQDRDSLHTVRGAKVDFDQAYRVCGQCHAARQEDWYFGAHGKRVGNWKGEPERYNCTHCHNPHQPPFMKRKAKPPPPVRAGLQPMHHAQRDEIPIWQRPIAARKGNSHE